MGAAVKPIAGRRARRGLTPRGARVRRLRERLAVETDPRVRSVIEAQLAALDPRWR